MYTDEFHYTPSIEVLPEVIDELYPLFEAVNCRKKLLDMFAEEHGLPSFNTFAQNVMDLADEQTVKKLEHTLRFLKDIEMFDTMFNTQS
jgi:hypothetical protein